jgi:DNA-binding NarL/FixJ family response regulator
LAADNHPDVVVMDYHLPGGTGAQAAMAIRAAAPATPILFFSADDSDIALFDAVEAGASGYLHKGSHPDLVLEAVRRVAAGEMLIPAADLARLISAKRSAAQSAARTARTAAQFTDREREVLLLMRDGLDNSDVAARMFIELSTVRWHIRNILDKLGAHTKLEAVARAAELGLLEH